MILFEEKYSATLGILDEIFELESQEKTVDTTTDAQKNDQEATIIKSVGSKKYKYNSVSQKLEEEKLSGQYE